MTKKKAPGSPDGPRRPATLPRARDRLRRGPLALSPLIVGEVSEPRVVLEAFDVGHNCFAISADLHWPAYEATRRGLAELLTRRGARDRLVVVGVSWAAQGEHSVAAFGELLEAIPRLERLDVLCAGGVGAADAMPRVATLAALRREAAFGCRAVGAAFHDLTTASFLLEHGLLDFAMLRVNALDAATTGRPLEARPLVLGFDALGGFAPPARLDALGVDPLNWRPAKSDHYRYVLSLPDLDGVLLSTLGPGELAKLDAALAQGPLDSESQAYLLRTSRIDPRRPLRSS